MKRKKPNETEYLYASARVRATENRLIGGERIAQAIAARGTDDVNALIAQLSDSGNAQSVPASDIFTEALGEAYRFVEDIAPEKKTVRPLEYQYDCNNIKSALKCFLRGTSSDGMMFSFGSVPTEKILEMPASRDFSALPKNMAESCEKALEMYAKTGSPQWIDILIDAACFADMLEAARESGDELVSDFVRTKIDLTNIMMCVRTLRIGAGVAALEILRESLVPGGNIEPERLLSLTDKEKEDGLSLAVSSAGYAGVASLVSEDREKVSLASIERACDDAYMENVRKVRFVPFGASVLYAYIVAVEYEIKNLRIILAGKQAGLSADTIRERVRASYV